MGPDISIALVAADRRRLEAIIRNRNAMQKHVWRSEIVLLSAGGLGTAALMLGPASQRAASRLAGTLRRRRGQWPPAR